MCEEPKGWLTRTCFLEDRDIGHEKEVVVCGWLQWRSVPCVLGGWWSAWEETALELGVFWEAEERSEYWWQWLVGRRLRNGGWVHWARL